MAETKKKPLILKQKPMLQMVYVLIPVALASVYFFGWRALAVLALVNLVGFLTEYIFCRAAKMQVSSAVFVTNFLFALSLPPTIPYWIAVVGIVFGVLFGKMVFGGFGRNIFNPAISGRAFIFVSFGVPLTSAWVEPFSGGAAGFTRWAADATASATPLARLAEGAEVPLTNLLFGNISGSFGETSAVLIILCGLYLMIRKVASFRIVLGGFIGYGVFQAVFWLAGIPQASDPLSGVLAGSFLFGTMFMATDPISASQTTDPGRWIYGIFFGIMCSLMRVFSNWTEAVTFALLLANMFAPLLDHLLKQRKARLKGRAEAAAGAGDREAQS
ncbi:MAG: RnfABCDGE type electron transport complex subunit D [Spirochaetia bacterium]